MALGDELVAGCLGYARARLDELRTAALTDVAQFANAAGMGGFADAGNVVAGFLTTARDELDQVAPSLVANNLVDAATHLGAALGAVDQAAKRVGGKSLIDLLAAEIGWGAVPSRGLAQQLGLPAGAPALVPTDGAVVYKAIAPGSRSRLFPPRSVSTRPT